MSIKPSVERLLWFFGAAIIAAAALGFVLVPARGNLARERQSWNDARGKLEVARRTGASFQVLDRARRELTDKSTRLDPLFATKATAVEFLSGIEALGTGSGVTAAPTFPTEPADGVRAVPITIAVVGPLDKSLAFLTALTTRAPVIIIDAVELSGDSTIHLTLHGEVAWR